MCVWVQKENNECARLRIPEREEKTPDEKEEDVMVASGRIEREPFSTQAFLKGGAHGEFPETYVSLGQFSSP